MLENNRNASIPAQSGHQSYNVHVSEALGCKPRTLCILGTCSTSDLHTSSLWGTGCFVTVVFCVFAFGFCFEVGSSVAQMGPELIM